MKNETIKTYEELTVEQAGELLRDNGWKPTVGLAFKDHPKKKWNELGLTGIDLREDVSRSFTAGGQGWEHCAKVTEIDPCRAPDGCPELEPWMAYIGEGSGLKENGADGDLSVPGGDYYFHFGKGQYATDPRSWTFCGEHTTGGANYMAIDVRSVKAMEAWPEHCRIRAYIDPVIHRKVSGMLRDKTLDEEIGEDIARRLVFVPDASLHMDDRQISLLAIKLASLYTPERSSIGSRIAAYYDVVKEFVKEEASR